MIVETLFGDKMSQTWRRASILWAESRGCNHCPSYIATNPPYGTTWNYWNVPLLILELWEAVKGTVLSFA